MNKIIIAVACLMFTLHSNSQWYSKYYAKTDFMDHTMDEISFILKSTSSSKSIGLVMMVGGLATTTAGFVLFVQTMPILPWDDSEPSVGGLVLGGFISIITGMVITSIAVYRIKEIKNALSLYNYENI